MIGGELLNLLFPPLILEFCFKAAFCITVAAHEPANGFLAGCGLLGSGVVREPFVMHCVA